MMGTQTTSTLTTHDQVVVTGRVELGAEPEDAANVPEEDVTTTPTDIAETHEPAAGQIKAITIDDARPNVTTAEGRSFKQQAESDADSGNDHDVQGDKP
jgi:hypothetical protein